MGEDYVTTAEAATILGLTSGWVAALCRNGILKATGGGRGALWLIKRSSIDEFAEQRSEPVDEADLISVAKEIEEDEEAQEFAKEKAEDSFRDRVINIAKRYGPGVLFVVAGGLGHYVIPGNPISDHIIGVGIAWIADRFSGSRAQIGPSPPQVPPKKNKRRHK
jgi:excisionase family DNA binding protein